MELILTPAETRVRNAEGAHSVKHPNTADRNVLATDPEAPIDLAAWAADAGYAFSERAPGEYAIERCD